MTKDHAAPWQGGRRGIVGASSSVRSPDDVQRPTAPAQAPRTSLAGDGVYVGAIWKSPRDKSRAIDARLREYNGHRFAELRLLEMDGCGRMVPTGKGLTVSIAQLGKLTQLVGNAYRKAEAMKLTPRSSS